MRMTCNPRASKIQLIAQCATAILIGALFVSCAPAPETARVSPYAGIESLLEQARQDFQSPGLSAAVALDEKLVWSGGFGLADVENDVPASAESVYRIGSVSKPIAAVALMQLVEQGAVSLDEPIQKYVPEFPEKRPHKITLRHILAHRAGVPNTPPDSMDPELLARPEEIVALLCEQRPLWRPGTRPGYHAVTTGFLGGLTTFSSFSAETTSLMLRAQWGWAAAIVGAHVAGSIAMTLAGFGLVRLFLRG